MKLEKVVLFLGGAACLAAFFLPYLTFAGQSVSGLSMVMATLDASGVVDQPGASTLLDGLLQIFGQFSSPKDYALLGMLAIVLFGPFMFAIFGLFYLVKSLIGKQYQRGIFLNLLFLGFAWLTFFLIGKYSSLQIIQLLGDSLSFFQMAGPGFWVGFGGMILSAFSLFFGKTE